MESISTIYQKDNRYLSKYDKYTRYMYNHTRATNIDWKKNINTIIEMSITSSNITLDISATIELTTKRHTKKKMLNSIKKNTIGLTSDVDVDNIENRYETHRNMSFWDIISLVKWYDRDEKILTKRNLSKLSQYDKRFLLNEIDIKYIPELKKALSNVPLLESVDIEHHNNILTHIIMNGKQFYEGIIQNPEVSLYLISQYYPVNDWLY